MNNEIIKQELLMLRSGMLGAMIDLKFLIDEDLICSETARIYLADMGASEMPANENQGKLSVAMQKCHAGV
jgi:hypothetical protein